MTSHSHGHVALVSSTVVTVSTLLHKKLKTVAAAVLNIINTLTTEVSLAVTQCSSCLAQLICLQLPKKFFAVCGTRRFIVMLTTQVSMVTVELGLWVVLQPRRMWKERLLVCVCTAGGHMCCHIQGPHFCFVSCCGNLVIPVRAMNCYGNACVIVAVIVINVLCNCAYRAVVRTVQLCVPCSCAYHAIVRTVQLCVPCNCVYCAIVCTVQLSPSYNFVWQTVENQFSYDFYSQTDK